MVYARRDDIDSPDSYIFKVISTSLPDDKKVKFIKSILEKYKSFNQGVLHATKIESNLFRHLNIEICQALITCYGQENIDIDMSFWRSEDISSDVKNYIFCEICGSDSATLTQDLCKLITAGTVVNDEDINTLDGVLGENKGSAWESFFRDQVRHEDINLDTILRWVPVIEQKANEQFKSDNAKYLRGVIQSKLEILMTDTSENKKDIEHLFQLFDCIKEHHGRSHAVRRAGNFLLGKSNRQKIEDLSAQFRAASNIAANDGAANDSAASDGPAEDSISGFEPR